MKFRYRYTLFGRAVLLIAILLLASCSRGVIFVIYNNTGTNIIITMRGFPATDEYPAIRSKKFVLEDGQKSSPHAIANIRGPYTFTLTAKNCSYAYDDPAWQKKTLIEVAEEYNIEFDLPATLMIKVEEDFSLRLFAKQPRKKIEDSVELFEWGFPMQPQVTCDGGSEKQSSQN